MRAAKEIALLMPFLTFVVRRAKKGNPRQSSLHTTTPRHCASPRSQKVPASSPNKILIQIWEEGLPQSSGKSSLGGIGFKGHLLSLLSLSFQLCKVNRSFVLPLFPIEKLL